MPKKKIKSKRKNKKFTKKIHSPLQNSGELIYRTKSAWVKILILINLSTKKNIEIH